MVLVVALPNYNTFEITRLLLIHIATIASILYTICGVIFQGVTYV